MNQGIIVKKIWSDEDLIKIDVAASDGYPQHHAFAGVLGHIGGLPVPVNVTVCGDPATLSKIISVPTCGVVSGGVKVTENLQLFPGASVF